MKRWHLDREINDKKALVMNRSGTREPQGEESKALKQENIGLVYLKISKKAGMRQ